MSTLNILSQLTMVVGRAPVDAADRRRLDSINPATGEVLAAFPRGGERDVERAVQAASAAFPAGVTPRLWSTSPLHTLADRIKTEAEELGHLAVERRNRVRPPRDSGQSRPSRG